MLKRGIIMLHENVCPHVACTVLHMVEVLDHPCRGQTCICVTIMCLIPSRKCFKGHRFGLDRHHAVTVKRFEQQPREFSAEGIHWLVCPGMPALMS
jgi:hypothetical protein